MEGGTCLRRLSAGSLWEEGEGETSPGGHWKRKREFTPPQWEREGIPKAKGKFGFIRATMEAPPTQSHKSKSRVMDEKSTIAGVRSLLL